MAALPTYEELRYRLEQVSGQFEQKCQENNELRRQLEQERQQSQQLRAENQQKDAEIGRLLQYVEKLHALATNKNMPYMDRIFAQLITKPHREEVLDQGKFQLNVARVREEGGISESSATKCLAAMNEAGGIKYDWTPAKEGQKFTSESVVEILPTFDTQNTKAAAKRVEERKEDEKRRKARLDMMNMTKCPSCHSSEHFIGSTHFYCLKCRDENLPPQHEKADQMRVVREEVVSETEQTSSPDETPILQDFVPDTIPDSMPEGPDWMQEASEIPLVEPDDIRGMYEEDHSQVKQTARPKSVPTKPVPAKVINWRRQFTSEGGTLALAEGILVSDIPKNENRQQNEQFINRHTDELKALLATG